MGENHEIPANCPRCHSPRWDDDFAILHCGEWTCLSYPEIDGGFHQTETCQVRELTADNAALLDELEKDAACFNNAAHSPAFLEPHSSLLAFERQTRRVIERRHLGTDLLKRVAKLETVAEIAREYMEFGKSERPSPYEAISILDRMDEALEALSKPE